MSESKFTMAKKLQAVQKKLMKETIDDFGLEQLIPLIFEKCSEEQLTFWFSFIEDTCVLNLRDVNHHNHELNIRQYTGNSFKFDNLNAVKIFLLTNTFLLTAKGNNNTKKSEDKPLEILEGDTPVPSHINNAIEKIKSKGIPVTAEAIHNHLPLGKMSTNEIMKCNKYLKQMEDSS